MLSFLLFIAPQLDVFFVDVLHLNVVAISKAPFSPLWVVSGVIIGIAEELIFRGYGDTILKKYVKR